MWLRAALGDAMGALSLSLTEVPHSERSVASACSEASTESHSCPSVRRPCRQHQQQHSSHCQAMHAGLAPVIQAARLRRRAGRHLCLLAVVLCTLAPRVVVFFIILRSRVLNEDSRLCWGIVGWLVPAALPPCPAFHQCDGTSEGLQQQPAVHRTVRYHMQALHPTSDACQGIRKQSCSRLGCLCFHVVAMV